MSRIDSDELQAYARCMPLRPCAFSTTCPGDDLLGNYSAESPDPPDYLSVFFSGRPPRLLTKWSATECAKTFVSIISQEDADIQAEAAALLCTIQGDAFFNQAQTCCIPCPDGNQFCYTFPAGVMPGETQDEANQIANQLACSLALKHEICIGPMASECCEGSPFSATLTISGPGALAGGNVWAITSGTPPPGLHLSSSGNNFALLSGTPTSSGSYFFSVGVRTAQGDFMSKVFGLCVVGINPSSQTLPPATQDVAYSSTFSVASCVVSNPIWTVVLGTLPTGITLNPSTGVLSGIPTVNGSYMFTIQVNGG